MAVRTFRILDFSGGIQTATSRLLRRPNEVTAAKNAEFRSVIGGATRRLGYTEVMTGARAKPALGAWVHRWATGTRQYLASNAVGDATSVISYYNGASWTDLVTGLSPNVKYQAMNHLGESYVFGGSAAGTYIDPRNIDSTPNASTTRNLYLAPRAKYIAEFQGSLFAINAQVNLPAGYSTLPDRAYKSSAPTGAITFVKGDQALLSSYIDQTAVMLSATTPSGTASASTEIPNGSAWMAFDGNASGTGWGATTTTGYLQYDFGSGQTKILNYYSITISPSDVTYAPASWTFQGSNNGSSWTTLDTQTTVATWSLGEKRGYEFTNSTAYRYYRINITANKGAGTVQIWEAEFSQQVTKVDSVRYIKVGQALDVYKARTETSLTTNVVVQSVDKLNNTFSTYPKMPALSNRDEIWGYGRKGLLSVYWNTDYPTTENSDFLRIPQGKDDAPEFIGWAKTTARLFLFTRNSFYKYDGANFLPVSTTIGALSHEAIQVIGSWVIFPHYSGLYGYNDSTGQLQLLSRGYTSWFKGVPDANWSDATAGVADNVYKLAVNSGSNVERVVYDFDSNNFTLESHSRTPSYHFLQSYSGKLKLHFADNAGKLFVDEVGNTDTGTSIPFELELGRNNFAIDQIKNYLSAYIYTVSPRGATVKYQLDGKEWEPLGELREEVQFVQFPAAAKGRDINIKVTQNDDGDSITVLQVVVNFNTEAQNYE